MSNPSTTTLPVRMGTIIAALITSLCVGCGGGGGGGDSGGTTSAGTGSTPTSTTPTATTPTTPPASSPPIATATTTTGWTTFIASRDTRIVYVSSRSGNDSNDGLSTSTPKRTLAAGNALIRQGYPDWLLLKKGDAWTNESWGGCIKSGRSSTEPMLISSYGTGARPLIKVHPSQGEGIGTNAGGGCVGAGNNIALVGLEFYAYTRDPSSPDYNASTVGTDLSGTFFLNPFTYMLIEDNKFSFFKDNIVVNHTVAPNSRGLIIRRNIIVNAYAITAHAQGIYIDFTDGALIEENLIDHNGWNSSVAGASPTVFNHNIYIQTTSGTSIVRGNIISYASSHGLQQRFGGVVYDNLFVRNPLAQFSARTPSTITFNVVTEGQDLDASNPRGYGLGLNSDGGNALGASNSTLRYNIVANIAGSTANIYDYIIDAGLTGVTMTNNISYSWGSSNHFTDQGSGNTTSPNERNQSGYPAPTRSVGSYFGTLGGTPTLSAFLTAARTQSKDNWNTNLMAHAVNTYIRAGFGKGEYTW
jgi:hypothetical protein